MAGRKTPTAASLRSKTAPDQDAEVPFKIDDSVPIPSSGKYVGASVQLREVLLKLQVGQSTTVPVDPDTGRAAVRLSNALRGVRNDHVFMQRKVVERDDSGKEVALVRIWRTK